MAPRLNLTSGVTTGVTVGEPGTARDLRAVLRSGAMSGDLAPLVPRALEAESSLVRVTRLGDATQHKRMSRINEGLHAVQLRNVSCPSRSSLIEAAIGTRACVREDSPGNGTGNERCRVEPHRFDNSARRAPRSGPAAPAAALPQRLPHAQRPQGAPPTPSSHPRRNRPRRDHHSVAWRDLVPVWRQVVPDPLVVWRANENASSHDCRRPRGVRR